MSGHRAGKAATGYALRVLPRAIQATSESLTNQLATYTYPQPVS